MAFLGSADLLPGASDCELLRDGLLAQPSSTVSSLAFVAAGIVIAAMAWRGHGWRTRSMVFAGCMVATGLGSVAYHGPQPPGAELMHDLSITFLLLLIALHDIDLLAPRCRPVLFTFAAVAISLTGGALLAPVLASLATDALVLVILVAEVLIRQRGLRRARTEQRRILVALCVVVVIAACLFALGRSDSPACDPTSPLQLHAAWHVAAAGAFSIWWWLALAKQPAPKGVGNTQVVVGDLDQAEAG